MARGEEGKEINSIIHTPMMELASVSSVTDRDLNFDGKVLGLLHRVTSTQYSSCSCDPQGRGPALGTEPLRLAGKVGELDAERECSRRGWRSMEMLLWTP